MGSIPSEQLFHRLSPVDHLSPRIHVPKLLYFQTSSSPSEITSTLRNGLSNSISALPILAGTVSLMSAAPQKGTLAIQAPFYTASDIFSVRDASTEYEFEAIKKRHFPPDAIDVEEFSKTANENPSRVFLAQAILINGGFVLVFAIHHCVVDETGIFDIVELWSACCRGEDGTDIVKPSWIDRTPLMTGTGTGNLPDHPEFKLLPAEDSATYATTKPAEYISSVSSTSSSAIFFFSDSALAKLKTTATGENEGDWISTNDALCALIWNRVTSARQEIGITDPNPPYTMFNMVINGRSRLSPPIPSDYMGNCVFISKAFLALSPSSSPPSLSSTASTLRKSILEVDSAAMQDKILAVSKVDDIGRLAPGGYNSHGRHLGCTSWAGQEYYSLDWGRMLGEKCERVRWRKTISDGIFVIFPRLEGGLEVYLGLQKACLAVLRKDEMFNEFAEWRC